MRPHTPLAAAAAPAETAGGILRILRGEAGGPAADAFVSACSGSAKCRDVCPEGLDPYTMMRLARFDHARARGAKPPPSDFKLIDLSLEAQIGPERPRWFTRRPPPGTKAEVVFYMGCNVMRTPHIVLTTMAILDAIGVNYHTVGGGANCCGIKQFRAGMDAAETVARNTLENFSSFEPQEVVSWCPTCTLHFNDFGATYVERDWDMTHMTRFLVERLDRMRPHLRPLPLRVVIEEHSDLAATGSVTDDVRLLLEAIPGLEVVPVEQHAYGYQCNAIADPALVDAELSRLLDAARALKACSLVTVYHGCHRALVKMAAARRDPFEVVNYVSLLARSLGIEQEDRYRRYAELGDGQLILEEALLLQDGDNGVPLDDLRKAIQWEFGT
jgi:Fe-S oxidoreductase